jgi:hypothetical protein
MAGHRQNGKAPNGLRAPGSYYEIRAEFQSWDISVETAVRIGEQLERRWRPRWIKFVDLHGARVWVRGNTVFHLAESTELQRVRQRDFNFMLSRERSADDERYYPDCDSGSEWE